MLKRIIKRLSEPARSEWKGWKEQRTERKKSAILRAKPFKVEDALILTGDPRGGTTWLMEMLARLPGTVINWEPLHHGRGVVPQGSRWGRRPYFPPDDKDPDRFASMCDILNFQRSTPWTTKHATLEQAQNATQVLTKFVRANLLLPWLTTRIEFARPPILLLRHPIPTSLSQLSTFALEEQMVARIEVPDAVFSERYTANLDYLNGLTPGVERKVASWCVNNLSTIRDPHHGKTWVTVYYEDLLQDPQRELSRIALAWGIDPVVFTEGLDPRKASATTFGSDLRRNSAEQAGKWSDRIDHDQKQRIQDILDHFGVDEYSAFEAAPVNRRL